MSFTHLIFLWGLLGLLIPLAIHLWNKKPPPTVKVGSTLLFPESSVAKMKNVSLSKWWLLLLRLLMLSILVLFLVKPFIEKEVPPIIEQRHTHITLVAQDFYQKTSTDFFTKTNKPIHFLLPDFPLASDTLYTNTHPINYWELLSTFDLADSATIYAPKDRFFFDGPKPKLPFYIKWENIPTATDQSSIIGRTSEAEAVRFHTTPTGNYYSLETKEKTSNDSLPVWTQPTIGVGFGELEKSKEVLLRKALEVLSEKRAVSFDFSTPNPQWWFYKTAKSENPTVNLNVEVTDLLSNKKLFQNKITNHHIQLIGDLSKDNDHIGELPLILETFLPLPLYKQAFDKRQLTTAQILPDFELKNQAPDSPKKAKSFLSFPLWLTLLGLFLLERWASSRS